MNRELASLFTPALMSERASTAEAVCCSNAIKYITLAAILHSLLVEARVAPPDTNPITNTSALVHQLLILLGYGVEEKVTVVTCIEWIVRFSIKAES